MNNSNLRRKMIRFLKENGLQDEHINEVKKDLIDMESEATIKNQTLVEFLGKDYKEFCIELLEVGYDFSKKDIMVNDQLELIKISREILIILIPSIILSISTFIISNYVFEVYLSIGVILTFVITYSIISRDKVKYSQFTKELIFTNIIAFLLLLFFSLPTLNVLGDGIFGNYYNGIYESLIVQWVRVIEYAETAPIVILNENIIVINDYLISFSLALLIGYAFYTYLFKKTNVKYFMIPLATIAIILVLLEYLTNFQIPFMGALIFMLILVFYIQQFLQLRFGKRKEILAVLGSIFIMVLLVSLLFNIEFIKSDELYYGQDLLYVIKIILIVYLIGITTYTLIGINNVSVIQRFYTFLNIFIIAYAMFMITSYIYQGIEQFNIDEPLKSWQSIRIINQMAFAAFGYYIIDSLVRKFGNLDNQD